MKYQCHTHIFRTNGTSRKNDCLLVVSNDSSPPCCPSFLKCWFPNLTILLPKWGISNFQLHRCNNITTSRFYSAQVTSNYMVDWAGLLKKILHALHALAMVSWSWIKCLCIGYYCLPIIKLCTWAKRNSSEHFKCDQFIMYFLLLDNKIRKILIESGQTLFNATLIDLKNVSAAPEDMLSWHSVLGGMIFFLSVHYSLV